MDFTIHLFGTLPETNSSPLKIGLANRKVVFQPSIFRGELLNFGRVLVGPNPSIKSLRSILFGGRNAEARGSQWLLVERKISRFVNVMENPIRDYFFYIHIFKI